MNEERSRIMRAVKSQDTAPELKVRRMVHSLGYRYRLHRKDLPGSPDLVFPGLKKVIFVHGCFWHGHSCARGARQPKTNVDYWRKKIERNIRRDIETGKKMKALGWKVLVIWECHLKDSDKLRAELIKFLAS